MFYCCCCWNQNYSSALLCLVILLLRSRRNFCIGIPIPCWLTATYLQFWHLAAARWWWLFCVCRFVWMRVCVCSFMAVLSCIGWSCDVVGKRECERRRRDRMVWLVECVYVCLEGFRRWKLASCAKGSHLGGRETKTNGFGFLLYRGGVRV